MNKLHGKMEQRSSYYERFIISVYMGNGNTWEHRYYCESTLSWVRIDNVTEVPYLLDARYSFPCASSGTNKRKDCKEGVAVRGGAWVLLSRSIRGHPAGVVSAGPRCQSRLLFLLPAQWRENVFYVWAVRGVGSIAEALISVGIVRINDAYCRLCCLFPKTYSCLGLLKVFWSATLGMFVSAFSFISYSLFLRGHGLWTTATIYTLKE